MDWKHRVVAQFWLGDEPAPEVRAFMFTSDAQFVAVDVLLADGTQFSLSGEPNALHDLLTSMALKVGEAAAQR